MAAPRTVQTIPSGADHALMKQDRQMHRVKKPHPRLTHGCYSTKRLLPGENKADREKLRREIVADLKPSGALEEDIIEIIAWLMWRKKNMGIFVYAEHLRRIRDQIIEDECRQRGVEHEGPRPEVPLYPEEAEDNVKREEAVQAGEAEARRKIGRDEYEWIESKAATVKGLLKDVELEERLNASIYKCVKQLLMVRGVKSLPPS
jgi:hypothetical protein